MPEKLFYSAAPKILKTLEEPPDKTLFLLVAEQQEEILNTILSRTQIIQIPRLKDEEIIQALIRRNHADEKEAEASAMLAGGNYVRAMNLAVDTSGMEENLQEFMTMTRLSFELHKKHELQKTQDLLKWVADMTQKGREYQKNFLNYALRLFREATLQSYHTNEMTKMSQPEKEFMDRFHKVVNHANILKIAGEFEQAVYAVERNGNGNLIFMDLCFMLNRELRRGYKALTPG